MSLAAIVLISSVHRVAFSYGRLARQFASTRAPTPAHTAGRVDFEPTAPLLLGQHFSAIAAAGPIVGPILACQQFGWLPCLLWIVLGCILIGAMHDFAALVGSVRHRACSVAEILKQHLNARTYAAFTLYIWLALVYVIVAFTDSPRGSSRTWTSGQAVSARDQGPGWLAARCSPRSRWGRC
jgi:carbon starvation protein